MKDRNLQISRRDLLGKGAAFAAAAALALSPLAPQTATAEEVAGWASFQGALDFAAAERGIGIVIFEGKDLPYTPDQIGRGLVKWLHERDVPARYFTHSPPGKQVTSISLIITPEDVLGPYNLHDAMVNMPQAVERLRVSQLHSPTGYTKDPG
ncbi:MAG: twin-arginine translocation signal domain-containing protein [Gammaproteobacteria bacterium]